MDVEELGLLMDDYDAREAIAAAALVTAETKRREALRYFEPIFVTLVPAVGWIEVSPRFGDETFTFRGDFERYLRKRGDG